MTAGAPAADTAGQRIVVTSIGTAGPAAVAAVAKGLGVPLSRAVACLYRAPSVLAENVPSPAADDMVRLLRGIGFDAHATAPDTPPPPPERLFDVALHLSDPRAADSTAEALAAFAGLTAQAALEMILTPPGLVLGAVSAATVAALRDRLPAGVDVVAARPEDSRYHLFLLDGPAVVRARLMPDLVALGVAADTAPGLIATGIDHATLQGLWRRHQAGGMLRAVNEAFLRFDIVATRLGPDTDPAAPDLATALARLTGMPAALAPAALAQLPLTMIEGAPLDEVAGHLERFAALGIAARADLTTFQSLCLDVPEAADPTALHRTLGRFGVSAGTPPFRIQPPMPEPRARMLRAALEDAGAVVRFAEGM
ncbi:MAG: hypothetical protein ACXIUV_02445 [Alkalilacustris sp.]